MLASMNEKKSLKGVRIMFMKFLKSKSGATAIVYGLIAALIAVAIIGAISAVGDSVSTTFDEVSTAIDGV